MAEPEIVAFVCNWCAYAGADYAGVSRIQYPANVRLIRVMCSGRVEPSFMLKAFEDGADGVLVGGCHEADCHYMSGNVKARARVEETRSLLDLLGLGGERLRIKWVNANEGEVFASEIADFTSALKSLGPNPLKAAKPVTRGKPPVLAEIMARTNTNLCVECGKCTASCPVSRRLASFSPRMTVEMSLEKMASEIETGPQLWECLTCRTCEERCPYNVRFSEFIREARVEAQDLGLDGCPTQSGQMYSWMRMMARDGLSQQRTGWADGFKTKARATSKNDIMFFVGCLPHFGLSHRHVGADTLGIATNTLAILNAMGIAPVLLADERCCGHDLLFAGEPEAFEALARRNAEAFKKAGVKRIVTACAEGYQTLAVEYPRVLEDWDVEVMHISGLMAQAVETGNLTFENDLGLKVTYQDPCRLGRYMDEYEAPRAVLGAMPGVELVEMEHHGPDAVCCGVSSWISCGATAKSIQMSRLAEAKATGADVLVTACPKCQIHFSCALSGRVPLERSEVEIPIEDLTSLAVKALGLSLPEPAAKKPSRASKAKPPAKAARKKSAGKAPSKASPGRKGKKPAKTPAAGSKKKTGAKSGSK
ncbi:MAG: hydrogenase iron-sulfur subunit [Actinobacteria bacterium]|nr:hydrogenase iron-sulfur subunit [Actinomycetota bacterium]